MPIISDGNNQTGDELTDKHTTIGTTEHTGSYVLSGSEGVVLNVKEGLLFATSSDRIGIGTTTPNSKLAVVGDLVLSGSQLKVTSTGPTSLYLQADTDNVTETDTAFVKLTQDGAYLTSYLGYIGNDSQDPEGGSLTDGLENTLLLSCHNSFPGGPPASSRIQFATEQAVRMTIEDDGKVGIGTTSPSSKLHIESTSTDDLLFLETTEASNSASPVIKLKRNSSSPANADYLGQIKFQGENDADQNVTYAKITGKIGSVADGSEQGIIEIANMKNGSSGITARLRHDSLQLVNSTNLTVDGDVGIGNTSPAHALDVTGGATFSQPISFEDVLMTELSIPGIDLQTDTNAYRFNCPYNLTVGSLALNLDQHTTSGDVTVTVTNTTTSNTMITFSLTGTSLGGATTTVSNASAAQGDVITFAITATPANAQGLRAILGFRRDL